MSVGLRRRFSALRGSGPDARRSIAGRRRFLGVGRRLLTRLADRLPRAAFSPTVALGPESSRPSSGLLTPAFTGRAAAAVGRVWQATEQPERAQRWLERAARWGHADARLMLGHALLAGGRTGLDVVAHVGLAERAVGNPEAARLVFESVDPKSASASSAQRGLARSLLQAHRVDEAAQVALAHGDCDDLVATASIATHESAGSLTRTQLEDIIPLIEGHLRRHPGDTATQQQLAGIHLSLLRFGATHGASVSGSASDMSLALAAWTEETSAGNHRAAHKVKQEAAQRITNQRARLTGTVTDHVTRLQALNYIEGPAAALAEAERRWVFAPTKMERLVRRKLQADLSLLCGDPEPLRSLASSAPSPNDRASEQFHSMVAGRNVLVVGPAPTHQPDRELVDRHDTVVTTRRPFSFPAGLDRPAVMYLTNESAVTEVEQHTTWMQTPDRIVVLRPSMVRRPHTSLTRHEHTRIQPFEDATPLFGTHFAMQRIVHDLLAHGAPAVTISGVDFFLGNQTHMTGYDSGTSDRFASAPFNYSHDFAYDFWYTQTLRGAGLVSGNAGVIETLDQPLELYLDRLPRVFL